jgi:hypothetical protein
MMGIGVVDSIASVDEINKAKNREKAPKQEVKTEPNLVKVKRYIVEQL